MATATKNLCDTCEKGKGISKCQGCSKIFCFNHFSEHRQALSKQLDEVEAVGDLLRQTIDKRAPEVQQNILLQQIDDWENDSIQKIKKTASEARQLLAGHTTNTTRKVEAKLNKLTNQIRDSRYENDFIETDLRHWKKQLDKLTEELQRPSNIIFREDSQSLVSRIYLDILTCTESLSTRETNTKVRWSPDASTVAGGNQRGAGLNQLYFPWGIYIDDDERVIYIADSCNNRIVKWNYGATRGEVVAGGLGQGDRSDQLNNPTDVIFDKDKDCIIICDSGNRRVVQWPCRNSTSGSIIISDIGCYGLARDQKGYYYVSDCVKQEVRRWKLEDTRGTVVAGGNGLGSGLDQFDGPGYIFVDQDYSVYISDEKNHRVMKWLKGAAQGIVVAGGRGEGNNLDQLSGPRGVLVDNLGTVYVADYRNNRVIGWYKDAKIGTVIVGGQGPGNQPNQLYCPQDLSFDRKGNLYVVDLGNDRIQQFNADSSSPAY